MLLDVWAERAAGHFQHASGSAVGTGGAAEIPRLGTLGSAAAVRGHGLERQYPRGLEGRNNTWNFNTSSSQKRANFLKETVKKYPFGLPKIVFYKIFLESVSSFFLSSFVHFIEKSLSPKSFLLKCNLYNIFW